MRGASRRREQRGWYWYDWANSAFQTSVVTVFLGPYLTGLAAQAAGADGFVRPLGIPVRAAAYYPYLVSLSALLQVLAMPLVGAIADRTGRRRLLLGVFAYVGAVATMLLYFVSGTAYLLGGALFLVASVAFGCSIVVYHAFLPDIADVEDRDRVSSRGWALGYLGGGLLLAANLVLFQRAGALGLDTGEAVRISLVSAGGWWALFTVVPLLALRRPPAPLGAGAASAHGGLLAAGFQQLRGTLRQIRRAPATLTFLAAYLLYNDGVQTVISQASVFADQELELAQGVVIAAVLLVQAVAVVGALALGALAERFGAKRVVLASLVLWIAVLARRLRPAGRAAGAVLRAGRGHRAGARRDTGALAVAVLPHGPGGPGGRVLQRLRDQRPRHQLAGDAAVRTGTAVHRQLPSRDPVAAGVLPARAPP